MSSMYEITQYRPELRDQVVELLPHVLGDDLDLCSAYFRWKHEANPSTGTPLFFLAVRDGRVVGMRGFMGMTWEAGPARRTHLLLNAGDLVIHPDHRNRGLVGRIMKVAVEALADRGFRYLCNLSAGRFTHVSSLRSGWKSVGPRGTMRRPESPSLRHRVTRRLRREFGQIAYGQSGTPFARLDRRARRLRSEGIVVEEEPRVEAMACLLRHLPWDGRLRVVRDETYLRWRFENPRSRYRFLYLGSPELEGYLILHSRLHGGGEVSQLIDWEATTGKAASRLLDAALDADGFGEAQTWSATLGEEERRLLVEAGFKPHQYFESKGRERPNHLLLRALRDPESRGSWSIDGRPLLEMSSWDLRMHYSDDF